MEEKYTSLIRNNTWSLVLPVPNTNIIDCKWVSRLKCDKDGAITRNKAKFIVKGFRQQRCVDYHDTFSPVIKSTMIHVVLSLVITQNGLSYN